MFGCSGDGAGLNDGAEYTVVVSFTKQIDCSVALGNDTKGICALSNIIAEILFAFVYVANYDGSSSV